MAMDRSHFSLLSWQFIFLLSLTLPFSPLPLVLILLFLFVSWPYDEHKEQRWVHACTPTRVHERISNILDHQTLKHTSTQTQING